MIKYAPFTVKQAEYIRHCQSCWLNVAEGGKRAGKNIINLVAWAAALDTHPDKIHLAAGTSVSAAKMNILDSNGFGLKAIFDGAVQGRKVSGARLPVHPISERAEDCAICRREESG